MKRDMELVRDILLALEEHENPNESFPIETAFPNHPIEKVMEHVKILNQAGLVDAMDASSAGEDYYMPEGLTWQGHEFLDSIRNVKVWDKLKETIKEKGGSMPFAIMQDLAISITKAYFGMG